ncbi:MAG: hypothetical protein ACKV2V_13345 [Blastocatellia bacterium]
MTLDKGLLKSLAGKLANYKSTVPVFQIPGRSLDELHESAIRAGQKLATVAGFNEMRYSIKRAETESVIHFLTRHEDDIRHQADPRSRRAGSRQATSAAPDNRPD